MLPQLYLHFQESLFDHFLLPTLEQLLLCQRLSASQHLFYQQLDFLSNIVLRDHFYSFLIHLCDELVDPSHEDDGHWTCPSRTHNFLANIFYQAYNYGDFQWKLSFHLFLCVLLVQCCWRLIVCSKHLVITFAKAVEPEQWPGVNSFPSVGMVLHRWR